MSAGQVAVGFSAALRQVNTYHGVPRCLPFMPNLHLSERWNERPMSRDESGARTFRELADRICLHCCSGFALHCGFCGLHISRVRETPDDPPRIVLEARTCNCKHCTGRPDRHDFPSIELLLGVDRDPREPVVGNAVPVLQLRNILFVQMRFTEAFGGCGVEQLEAVFCSFRKTALWVQRNPNRVLAWFAVAKSVLRTQCTLDWDETLLATPECTLYTAVMLRVGVALCAAAEIRTNLRYQYHSDARSQWAVLMLQLFADTHLDLCVLCDTLACYTDVFLETPLAAQGAPMAQQPSKSVVINDSMLLSPLHMAYPHPLRAPFAGELCDATPSVALCNLWGDVGARTPSLHASFVHIFMCKATNHKCMKRDFDKMLCSEMGAHPELVPFVINLLECAHLGNYPGARERPHWRWRKLVRSTYHTEPFRLQSWCSSCNKNRRGGRTCSFCRYLHSIKMQVYLAVKEYLVFQVDLEGICATVLRAQGDWIGHERSVLRASDDLRRIMSEAGRTRHPRPEDLAHARVSMLDHADLMHDCDKPFNSRSAKTHTIAGLLLEKVAAIGRKDIVANWTAPQQPLDILLGCDEPEDRVCAPLRRAFHKQRHLGQRAWRDVFDADCVRAIARLMYATGAFRGSLMAHLGMSPEGADMVFTLMFNLEIRDMPDNNASAVLRRLRTLNATDFLILHATLAEYVALLSPRSFSLGPRVHSQHMHALRLRNRVAPHRPLPDDAGTMHYCTGCQTVYAFVAQPPLATNRKTRDDVLRDTVKQGGDALALCSETGARGVKGAHYSIPRGCLVCSRKTKYSEFEKRGSLGQSRWLEDKGNADTIRSVRQSLRICNSAPLAESSLIGRVLEVGGKLYTLCIVCGCICTFDDANPGPTCGHHHRVTLSDTYTSLERYSFVTHKTTVLATPLRYPEKVVIPVPPAPVLGCAGTSVMHAQCFASLQVDSVVNSVEFGRGSAMRNTTLRVEDTNFYKRREAEKPGSAANFQLRVRRVHSMLNRTRLTTRRRPTVVVCAYCVSRATRNAVFTQLTVNNSDATLRSYLEPDAALEPVPEAELFLCKHCFRNARHFLSTCEAPPLTVALWSAINRMRTRQQ